MTVRGQLILAIASGFAANLADAMHPHQLCEKSAAVADELLKCFPDDFKQAPTPIEQVETLIPDFRKRVNELINAVLPHVPLSPTQVAEVIAGNPAAGVAGFVSDVARTTKPARKPSPNRATSRAAAARKPRA